MTTCLVCGGNVLDGSDNTHKVAGGGWNAEPQKPGCGVVWTHVTADYPDHKQAVMEMYPGLIYAGFDPFPPSCLTCDGSGVLVDCHGGSCSHVNDREYPCPACEGGREVGPEPEESG